MGHIQPNTHLPKDTIVKIYAALLTQAGTNAPTTTSLCMDTTGVNLTWTRSGVGFYILTADEPLFTAGKTFGINAITNGAATIVHTQLSSLQYRIQTLGSGLSADGYLFNTPIEIRIYL